jgi:hypothetical protein
MRKLPSSVDVLGCTFKVTCRPMKKGLYGETDVLARTIDISTEYPLDVQWSAFLHEVIHAALGVSGQSEGLKDTKEEGIVLALENALAPLFQFKPKGKK